MDRLDPDDGPRADKRVQIGPGGQVPGVGEGGEGVGVGRIAGGGADAFGEAGVRAVEGGPDGVVEDG